MRKLRIAFLSYRSNPFSGGQGIYVKYMTKALKELGHQVTVFSGPPYPGTFLKELLLKKSLVWIYIRKKINLEMSNLKSF